MTNHPNRSNTSFRFIAFDTISGQSRAHAATAQEALALASVGLPDAAFLEVLDCGDGGRVVWNGAGLLRFARLAHSTVFHGDGYAASHNPLPAIALAV